MAEDRLKALLAAAKNGSSTPVVAKQVGTPAGIAGTSLAMAQAPTRGQASIAMSPEDQVRALIAQLSTELEAEIPGYSSTLRTIHKRLVAEEELTHILSEEEIGIIMSGQQKLTNTTIKTVENKPAAKTAAAKKLAQAQNLLDLL